MTTLPRSENQLLLARVALTLLFLALFAAVLIYDPLHVRPVLGAGLALLVVGFMVVIGVWGFVVDPVVTRALARRGAEDAAGARARNSYRANDVGVATLSRDDLPFVEDLTPDERSALKSLITSLPRWVDVRTDKRRTDMVHLVRLVGREWLTGNALAPLAADLRAVAPPPQDTPALVGNSFANTSRLIQVLSNPVLARRFCRRTLLRLIASYGEHWATIAHLLPHLAEETRSVADFLDADWMRARIADLRPRLKPAYEIEGWEEVTPVIQMSYETSAGLRDDDWDRGAKRVFHSGSIEIQDQYAIDSVPLLFALFRDPEWTQVRAYAMDPVQ